MQRLNKTILKHHAPQLAEKIGNLSPLEAFNRGRINQQEAWYISRIILSYYLQYHLKKSNNKKVVN